MKDEGIKTYVIDASVLIAWLMKEERDLTKVREVFRDYSYGRIKLICPKLFLWEVCNYIGGKLNSNDARRNSAFVKAFFTFEEADLNFETIDIAFEIMSASNKISFYDASYHALALVMHADFLTLDSSYFAAAKKFGSIRMIQSL